MRVIGVTGGIGAGKSTILNYLSTQYHVRVVKADDIGQMLTLPNGVCYPKVISEFGTEILGKDGFINRPKLAQIVFKDKKKLDCLDSIIHPEVRKYIVREIEREKKEERDFFFFEAALLLEESYRQLCDEIWYIYVDEQARMERLIEEREYTEEKCKMIFKNQCTEDEFRRYSDFEVDNSKEEWFMQEQIDQRMKSYENL